MHFKIKASFIGESHNLLENKTYGLYEQRIDEGVDFRAYLWDVIPRLFDPGQRNERRSNPN